MERRPLSVQSQQTQIINEIDDSLRLKCHSLTRPPCDGDHPATPPAYRSGRLSE